MIEKMKAYLYDWDGEISAANLDFESRQEIRRVKTNGWSFELGKYDWRDASVELLIERPDIVSPNKVQEEWEQEREWYLEHSVNGGWSALKGYNYGFLTIDEIQAFSYSLGLEEEERKLAEERYLQEEWDLLEGDKPKKVRKTACDFYDFLREGKKINDSFKKSVRSLMERIQSEREWETQEFEELGFKLPNFDESLSEVDYIMSTLDLFSKLDFVKPSKRPQESFLAHLLKECGLDSEFKKRAREEPWLAYEKLKEVYCSGAKTPSEYDLRIRDVLLALDL